MQTGQKSHLSCFSDLDYLNFIAEGKDRLIDRLPSLDNSQKAEMKGFLSRHPNLENKFDWNRPDSITYDAFKKVADAHPDPIDPDSVPEFSDKRDEGNGIFSYGVADTREGQFAVRKAVDTHWGKDANPWCIIHRDPEQTVFNFEPLPQYEQRYNELTDRLFDGRGISQDEYNELQRIKNESRGYHKPQDRLENAWYLWKSYSALPKRIAFKNGNLHSFMATNKQNPYWQAKTWDELDDGIWADEYERAARNGYEYSMADYMEDRHPDVFERYHNQHPDIPEEWWDRNDESHPDLNWDNE